MAPHQINAMTAVVFEQDRRLETLVFTAVDVLCRWIQPESYRKGKQDAEEKKKHEDGLAELADTGEVAEFKRGTPEDLARVKAETVVDTPDGPVLRPSEATARALREMHEYAQREGLPRRVARVPGSPTPQTPPPSVVLHEPRVTLPRGAPRLIGMSRPAPGGTDDVPLPVGPRGAGGRVLDSFGGPGTSDLELARKAERLFTGEKGTNRDADMLGGLLRRVIDEKER